jgi:hypothetical protein
VLSSRAKPPKYRVKRATTPHNNPRASENQVLHEGLFYVEEPKVKKRWHSIMT